MADLYKVIGRAQDFAASAAEATTGAVQAAANSDLANSSARTAYKVLGRATDFASETANTAADTASGVVDQASQLLDSASQTVSDMATTAGGTISSAAAKVADTASTTYDYVTEKTSEYWSQVPDTSEITARTASALGGVLAPVLPVNANAFAQFMSNGGKIELSAGDLNTDDVKTLRDTALAVIERGDSKFTYEDWGYTEGNVLYEENVAVGSLTNPNFRMASLIGQTAEGNVFIDDNGDIIIRDTYDFNSGPRGRQLTEALLLREAGDEVGYQRLRKEALDGLPYFGKLRVWAGALGAPQGEGTAWEINLGPANQSIENDNALLQSGP